MITTTIEKKNIQDGFFRKNKTAIIFAVKIVIAAGMLFYLASSIEYKKILSAIENANLLLIAAAFLLSFANIYLQYSKWRLTCGHVLEERKKSKILTSLFYGFSAGTITPLRVGEYFGRAIVFKNKSIVQVTVATLIDKFFPLMIVAFVGSVMSILFFYFYFNTSIYLTLSLFIVLFTLFYFFAMLLLSRRFWDSIFFSRIKKSKRFTALIEKLQVL
ncbi:MAG: flippase-like domain-containing protein, partial [Ignavibacteria bacterium]|nr:flippase-like domain-containing protein [Ignavibacteria bacterium]